ncbi:MAG: MoxR family ATPase [Chloroflexi bacterium]|nr:MoxR family ATPase [Chloroflexota bacterium]
MEAVGLSAIIPVELSESGGTPVDDKAVLKVSQLGRTVKENVGRVVVGKDDAVELAIVALLCEGHVLIEDIPGIGKTTLAKAIARSLGCTFRRIQCTPDLLPSDITGTYIFNQKTAEFEFRPGPIMAQVVLADEINRATPRTQSALLEAMQERQVTAEGETRPLPRPFMVLATQNPIELEGTFPLPEAQLDRFLLRIRMGYPTAADDREILARFRRADPLEELTPVVTSDHLLHIQSLCREVLVAAEVEDYIIRLIRATREHAMLQLGASPRAMLALYHAVQVLAALRGRAFVIPDDIKYIAAFVLAHRLITKVDSHLRGRTTEDILNEIISAVSVPVEEEAGVKEG